MIPLGDRERTALLALARASVERALDDGPAPGLAPVLAALEEPRAAFVTIRRRATGRLRGCRGECPARRALPECVRKVAVSAALDDPRFPPVDGAELPLLQFEISALTATEPADLVAVDLPEEIAPGQELAI